jgi:hypothetical protein
MSGEITRAEFKDEEASSPGSILQIGPVQRRAAKAVGVLAGQTGDGKTYSALMLALGLADFNPGRIGFLDTENGRGSLYDTIYGTREQDRFLIADLPPPHSPARYVQAMREFARKEIDVLVMDSGSHEWEGEGGCDEIANNPNKKIPDWLAAKREHKRFVNTLLFMPFHVIVCLRAREKTSFKDPKKPVSLGILPICEKNFMFEATFSFMLHHRGQEREIIKLPDCLVPCLGENGYLTEQHGKKLRDWFGGIDPMERFKNQLRLAASQGTSRLREAWGVIPSADRKTLIEFKDTLKDTASHADTETKRPDDGAPEDNDTLLPLGEEREW